MTLEDPDELLEDLPPWQRFKAKRFDKDLQKEREELRAEAIEIIKEAKEEDWSKKKVLKKLSPEQINLVGELLPEMLEAHLPEEVELILLDAADERTRKEERRRKKVRKKLQKHRRQEMLNAAEKIEELEAQGADKKEVLAELTRAERWALGDLLSVLVQSLPDAVRDLETYLAEHDDLREGERELLEDHLEHLRDQKIEHARKGLDHVDKLTQKGEPPKEIAEDLSILERVCLGDALRALLQPALSERIAGLEAHLDEAQLFEEEVEMWEDHIEELRGRREELREETIEKIKSLKADDEPPEQIADELSPAEADAVGDPLERILGATLPEDVDVLVALTQDGKVDKAREAAQGARAEALSEALAKVKRLRDGEDKLIGGVEPKEPREIVESLTWTERQLLEDVLEPLLDRDPLSRLATLEAHVEEASLSEPVQEAWDEHLAAMREHRDTLRLEAVDRIKEGIEEDEPPEQIAEDLAEDQVAVLGDAAEKMITATLPEDVEVLHQATRPHKDPEELADAREAAKEARRDAREAARDEIKELREEGAEPEAILEALDDREQTLLGDDLEEMVAAAVPEEVDLIALKSRDGVDRDELEDALEDAKSARLQARADALETLHDAQDAGEDLQAAIADLPYGQRKLLEEDPPEVEDGRLVEEPPDTGGLFSFLGSGGDAGEDAEPEPDESVDEAADEKGSGGGLGGLLSFGGGFDWKKEMTRQLKDAGVPDRQIVQKIRAVEDRIEDLPEDKQRMLVERVAEKARGDGWNDKG